MDLKNINILDIEPADYNPRIMTDEEYEKLSRSIDEFGFVDPIIINLKNNRIIAGHQRYDVLINNHLDEDTEDTELFLLPLGDIGWVFPKVDLTIVDETHEKALNLALNKITGDWDNQKLNELFVDLEVNGFDISLTGFEKIDLGTGGGLTKLEVEELPTHNLDLQEKELEKIEFENVDIKPQDAIFHDDFDLVYDINFNNPVDERFFYDFLKKIQDEYDEGTVSGNLLTYMRDKLESVDNKYNASYELIFDSEEEKRLFFQFQKELRERYQHNRNDNLINLMKEE